MHVVSTCGGRVTGENEVEQMQCVMEILGLPPAALMERATRKGQFFEADGSVRMTANKAGQRRFPASKDLSQALRCNDGPFLSFLQVKLLPILSVGPIRSWVKS